MESASSLSLIVKREVINMELLLEGIDKFLGKLGIDKLGEVIRKHPWILGIVCILGFAWGGLPSVVEVPMFLGVHIVVWFVIPLFALSVLIIIDIQYLERKESKSNRESRTGGK